MSTNFAVKDWADEGVRVVIPPQAEAVQINTKSLGDAASDEAFRVSRLLVNFEVVKPGSSTPVEEFTLPMIIIVGKYAAEEANADLALAYWKNNEWTELETSPCPVPFIGFVTAVSASISDPWDDPAMAWGTFTGTLS